MKEKNISVSEETKFRGTNQRGKLEKKMQLKCNKVRKKIIRTHVTIKKIKIKKKSN